MKHVFTYYQTNEPNILGGYMTYDILSQAFDALCPQRGINTITAVMLANTEWLYGRHIPCAPLVTELGHGVIYKA